MKDRTLEYYRLFAEQFAESTCSVSFREIQERFLEKLPEKAAILDFGCGSGRDARYFMERGFQVEASDGSPELCTIASQYTGLKVQCMLFQELSVQDTYDGIWACASILHLNRTDLEAVLQKMYRALKDQGIIYTSFKYGTFEGERNGRYFTDFTEQTFEIFLHRLEGLKLETCWITHDARPDRKEEKWLNLILRRRK